MNVLEVCAVMLNSKLEQQVNVLEVLAVMLNSKLEQQVNVLEVLAVMCIVAVVDGRNVNMEH